MKQETKRTFAGTFQTAGKTTAPTSAPAAAPPPPAPPPRDTGPKTSGGIVWFAAFVAAFCAASFVIVAKCLLRQNIENFPGAIAAGSAALGALIAIALIFVPRIWNLSSAAWLATACAFASACAFKFLPLEQVQFAVAPFAFGVGAFIASLVFRRARPLILVAIATLFSTAAGAAAGWYSIRYWLAPLGYTGAMYSLVAALALVFLIVAAIQRIRISLLLAGLATFGIAAFFAPGNLPRVTVPDGWTLYGRREGIGGSAMLIEKTPGPGMPLLQRLIVDERHIIGGELGFGEKRLGHVPLLLAPRAKSALFLNVGAGVVMGAAGSYVGLERIDGVESSPEVASFLPQFAIANERIYADPRVKIIHADPVDFLATTTNLYDVIVAAPTPPAREGAARQFSSEFINNASRHVKEGGVLVQWVPLYQIDEAFLRTILDAHGDARGFIGILNGELPVIGLVHRVGKPPLVSEITKVLQANLAARPFVADVRDLLASDLLAIEAFKKTPAGPRGVAGPSFSREFLLQPESAKRAGHLLSGLLAASDAQTCCTNPDPLAFWPDADEEADSLKKQITTRQATMRMYLEGDILRVRGDEKDDERMADLFLGAYAREPAFAQGRAMLIVVAMQRPKLTNRIFTTLIQNNPDDEQIRKLLLVVTRQHAQSAGLPIPPMPDGSGGSVPSKPRPPAGDLPKIPPVPRLKF